MNELIEQFVIESRELVEQASADLLALEKAPSDKAVLDSAFRAFHTLKGSAGIVDFTAMAAAVHAAEDVLSAVRSGSRRVTAGIISDCLACLDQVARWLDVLEQTDELPTGASAQAEAIVRRFAAKDVAAPVAQPRLQRMPDPWAEALVRKHEALRASARTAIRYAPDADCFFEHEDPFARMAQLPGLLAIDAQPASPWPPLDALDPFACNVVIAALTRAAPIEARSAMGAVADRCEIVALGVAGPAATGTPLSVSARDVLAAQIALVEETRAQGMAHRLTSAGVVVANVLRSARRVEEADAVARSAEQALARNDPHLLRAAIASLLGQPKASAPSSPVVEPATARVLRVDASRIDALVNVMGELTVAKNAIAHVTKMAEQGDPATAAMLKQRFAVLDGVVGELQRLVLGMRVLPLRQVFQRFPRLVREMASASGKPVELAIEGGETQADKTIVEMLFEPLLHVLRNAMDHGVEPASMRAARGKPPVATIVLRAARVGENVVVEVRDDGGGIDLGRVRSVALERNLVDAETLATLGDAAVIDMIFEPAFSTAAEVTGVSGRGVGMDAVRTAVQRVGGQVNIESAAGRGTTVRFTLPFSVMVTRIMIVIARGQAFGVPLDAVVETLRVDADRVVPIGAARAIVLRDRTVPVIDLAEALSLARAEDDAAHATIVVTRSGGRHGALRVDRIGERMDVMLKPLEGILAGTPGLAGSALLGDGSILLILDIAELLR